MHPLSRQKMVFKNNYSLMQIKSIVRVEYSKHSAILSTFIKLPVVTKIFVLSIFERPFYTGFTVCDRYHFAMGLAISEHL